MAGQVLLVHYMEAGFWLDLQASTSSISTRTLTIVRDPVSQIFLSCQIFDTIHCDGLALALHLPVASICNP